MVKGVGRFGIMLSLAAGWSITARADHENRTVAVEH